MTAKKFVDFVFETAGYVTIGCIFGLFSIAGADIPRAADGRPDLSGTYDIATLTPLQRPAKFGGRLTLSAEEAAAIAQAEVEFMKKSDAASDPERGAPPAGGDGTTGGKGNVGGYNSLWYGRGTSAMKINGQWRTSILVDPPNGLLPPMTEAAQAKAAARAKLSRKNTGEAWWIEAGLDPGPYDDPEMRPLAERCLLGFGSTGGPPMLPVLYNNLKRIVQTEDHLMILVEMVHDARIVRMNAEHAPPDVRKWLGDSVGHWEGDTLVVDTTNFTDRPALANASRNLHVVERFSRIDADTLLYRFTVEDPTVWTAPWSGEYVWPASKQRVYEYACHEGNYSFRGVLAGARALEAEASGKTDP